MEFDEKRLQRVRQTKLVLDKRQKDGHYMRDREQYSYPEYKRQKPRDEEEAAEREEQERKAAEEQERQAQKEREEKEDEELLQKELARLKAEGKIKDETQDVRIRTYQRVKKNKKAKVHKFDPVQQVREEIKRRRDAENAEKAENEKEKEEEIIKTPTGRNFRGLPKPSRLHPLMHPHSRHSDKRDEYKQLFKNQTRSLEDKRKIGRERRQEFLDEYFPVKQSGEQANENDNQEKQQEEKKKELSSLKESLLKKNKHTSATEEDEEEL